MISDLTVSLSSMFWLAEAHQYRYLYLFHIITLDELEIHVYLQSDPTQSTMSENQGYIIHADATKI